VGGLEKEFDALIGTENADAFVFLSGPLMHAFGREALEGFCARRSPLPMVSVGVPLASIATVRGDGKGGVKKAVSHLVDVHRRRRVGFIRGPATTAAVQERFDGYKEGLAESGIALNPEWVASTSALAGGVDAIKELFGERKQ